MATASQRVYRAACPNCGAAVEFASSASAVAVCSFCRSTLAREGDALRRIGASAELFDDHSPLQLGSAGRYQGAAFTLIGRLQMRSADGFWNEWHALFDSGRTGWLSEDNGRYVLAFDAPAPADAPPHGELYPGLKLLVDRRPWTVASVVRARINAVQGELPFAPNLDAEFDVADLRSEHDEVGTLDYSDPQRPHWSIGRRVRLDDLALSNLVEVSEKALRARGLACPNCGAALEIKLETTRSIVCSACECVVDMSGGIGRELRHYSQTNGMPPQLPLGSTGTLALGSPAKPWQVVGYMERRDLPGDPEEDSVFWREYLLYRRQEGFAFLVDAEDGWSWAVPITGVPRGGGNSVQWRGTTYFRRYAYKAETTYVLGEFYWKVERGQRSSNTDYAAGTKRLNREQALPAGEVTWSAGATLEASAVARAFDLPEAQKAALARDAGPLASRALGFSGTRTIVWIVIAMIVVAVLMARCSRDDCDELRRTFGAASNEYRECARSGSGAAGFRSRGGSYGGYGSGGSHK